MDTAYLKSLIVKMSLLAPNGITTRRNSAATFIAAL
jgi:hypothetical protein